jgi:hypothetical protein
VGHKTQLAKLSWVDKCQSAIVPERLKKRHKNGEPIIIHGYSPSLPNQLLFKLVAFNSKGGGKIPSWNFIDVLIGR